MIHQPLKMLILGSIITFIMLIFDGSLWRFWSLQRGQEDMAQRMIELEKKSKNLEFKIHQASQMTYIEKQATDQFDYVREGDLIFVFAD
jgi:cell division protein FtsB